MLKFGVGIGNSIAGHNVNLFEDRDEVIIPTPGYNIPYSTNGTWMGWYYNSDTGGG